MNTKPFYKTSIGYEVKEEWTMKEEGSWEDHNNPEKGHIYPLLNSMPNDKIICNTMEEAAILYTSAQHHKNGWDNDEPIVRRLMKKCTNICKQLKPLLTNLPVS